MKRTEYKLCCGTRNGYPVYRVVLTDGENYFVKWQGNIINVNKEIEERNYSYR